ncbi:hypothetical protein JHK87_016625 [Glycine soja]|nr:hypothetical protein JHK87_016625 [Glycine soja]
MGPDLKHALDAIRWAREYFLKATSIPGFVFAQVGDPYAHHNCWERPEDMDTPRTAFAVSRDFPGSEVSAASSILLINSSSNSKPFILNNADKFVCSVLPESPSVLVSYSSGGLLFKPGGSNLQHATTISFLFLVYAGYLKQTNKEINCGGKVFASPKRLKQIERGQISGYHNRNVCLFIVFER